MPKKSKATKKNTNRDDESPDFEASLQQLELIVGELEDSNLGLSESLVRYEEGVKHLKRCYELLQHAEQRIEVLSGVDADGRPVTKSFESETTNAGNDSKADAKRGGGAASFDETADVDDPPRLF